MNLKNLFKQAITCLSAFITQAKTKEGLNQTSQFKINKDIQFPVRNWKCIHTLIGYSKEIIYEEKTYTIWADNKSISISADCQFLATINGWRQVDIWDISKRQLIYSLDCGYNFPNFRKPYDYFYEINLKTYTLGQEHDIDIILLSDNQSLVSINNDDIKVFDITNGELKYKISCSLNYCISNEKEIIATIQSDSIKVIDLYNGNLLQTLPLEDYYAVEYIDISSNSTFLVASGNKFIERYEDANGKEYFESQNSIKVWNLYTGKLLYNLNEEIDITSSKNISSILISPKGKYLISVDNYLSTDGLEDTYKVWNLHTGELLYILPIKPNESIYCSGFTSNDWLITTEDSSIKIWDLYTGNLLTSLIGHSYSVYCLAVSSDNETLITACSDKTLKLWSLSTGKLLQTLDEHEYLVDSITLNPTGQIIASTDKTGTTKLWKVF